MLGNNEHDARDAEYGRSLTRAPSGGSVTDVGRYPSYDWMNVDTGDNVRDFQNYLRIVLRHWLIIVTAILVCLAGGLAKTLLSTPLFDATATIQIDREAAQVKNLQTWQTKETGSADEFFQTQYALLKSRSLAEAAAKDPNMALAQDPEVIKAMGFNGPGKKPPTLEQAQSALTGFIQGRLQVNPVQRSRVVQLTIESPNAIASSRIVNGVAENFINQTLKRRIDASAKGIEFLKGALDEQKIKLETAEQELNEYAKAQQIVTIGSPGGGGGGAPGATAGAGSTGISASSAGSNSTLAASSLAAMTAALNNAQTARITAEANWKTSQAMGATSMEMLASGAVQSLKEERNKLQAEYAEKLGIYKPEFDPMQKLQARIADLDKQINQESRSVQTAQSSALEKTYRAAVAQEDQLKAQVAKLTGQVLGMRSASVKFDILQREADTSRQLYDALLQQYKEIGVSGHIEANNISVVDRAQVPGGPSKPRPMRNMMLAGIIGLVTGVALAFLLEYLDESIRSPEDVEKKLGLPLLGSIPKLEKGTDPAAALSDVRSAFSEAYYSVRTALQFSTNEGVPSSLVITSARPSEGKSTSATALAKNFARLGLRVLLIDADMRNPSLHRIFQAENNQGLSNYLTGGLRLHSLAQQTDTPNLFFIPCGPLPPNPAELLGGLKIAEMFKESREFFDMVIIDAPPVMGLADAPLLASAAGGTVLVVEAGGTGRHLAKASIRRLNVGGSRLLGVLLTKFDARKSSYGYGYGYGYGYSYDYGSRPQIKGS